MARATAATCPPLAVIFGDEEYYKGERLRGVLDALLPAGVDRSLCLTDLDGARAEDQGGPSLARVFDDLATPPFLAERRVVLIRDADRFVAAFREKLERYLSRPSRSGVLVLVCRAFPKTTRLYKAAAAAGAGLHECRRPGARGLSDFVADQAAARGKRIDPQAAEKLIELIGPQLGCLAGEVEKLALLALDRKTIGLADVEALVGLSREEKIFAVVDAAGAGDAPRALELWRQVISSDPAAEYRAAGGVAFVLRRWLGAHRSLGEGATVREIAPSLRMWGRERELESLLRRLPPRRIRRALAALADLDAQAKVGARSIEAGVERLAVWLAAGPR